MPDESAIDQGRLRRNQALVLILTFLAYACFHMSRKCPSVVKSVLHPTSSDGRSSYHPETFPGFAPFSDDLVPSVVAKKGLVVSSGGLSDIRGDYPCVITRSDGVCLEYSKSQRHYLTRTTNATLIAALGYTGLQSAWLLRVDLAAARVGDCESWLSPVLRDECVLYAQGSDSDLPAPGGGDNSNSEPKLWDWKPVATTLRNAALPKVTPKVTSGTLLLGYCDSVFLVTYSVGMFVSGPIADRCNLKTFLGVGMIGTGIMVSLVGLALYWQIHSLWYFCVVYAVQGLFQSTGWPAVVSIVGRWLGKGKRGLVMGVWNAHTSVGNIMGSTIGAAALSLGYNGHNWGMSFILPGILTALVGVLILVFLVKEPRDIGLASPLFRPTAGAFFEEDEHEMSQNQPLLKPTKRGFIDALRIPGVVEFALCLFLAKLVAYVFIYWLPYYLAHLSFSSAHAGFLSAFIDIGGIAGGVVAGVASDRSKRRATVAMAFLVLATPTLWAYRFVTDAVQDTSLVANVVAMLIAGAVVNGPYALITTAVSADLGTHPSLQGDLGLMATVTGIIDGTGSVGAALQGVLIGVVSSLWGWDAVFYLLMLCSGLAALLLVRLVRKEFRGLN